MKPESLQPLLVNPAVTDKYQRPRRTGRFWRTYRVCLVRQGGEHLAMLKQIPLEMLNLSLQAVSF